MAEFLCTSDVARILDVAGATVISYERSGKLKALKTPRGVRLFTLDDVKQLAKEMNLSRGDRRKASPDKQCHPARAEALEPE